jgi:universal stress protein A
MSAFHHVLVGLELESENARSVLSRACQIAEPSEIEVVHVCDHLHQGHEDFGSGAFATSEALNERVIATADLQLEGLCSEFGIKEHHVLGGKTVDMMHAYAQDNADLVVVGCHGHTGLQTMFGSTSNAMLHDTPCDVLAVHITDSDEYQPTAYKNILVGVDLTEESNQVMEHALGIAEAAGAGIEVCHIYTSFDKKVQAREQRELLMMGARYGIDKNSLHSLKGSPAHALHDKAHELGADLIVIGAHGTHGLELLKGSIPNAMLHGAQCDTLSVRVKL